jgi:uncharacterized protein YicC (UPF0701 family)
MLRRTTATIQSILNQQPTRLFHSSIPLMSPHSFNEKDLLEDISYLYRTHRDKDSLDPHKMKRIEHHLEKLKHRKKKEAHDLKQDLEEHNKNILNTLHAKSDVYAHNHHDLVQDAERLEELSHDLRELSKIIDNDLHHILHDNPVEAIKERHMKRK